MKRYLEHNITKTDTCETGWLRWDKRLKQVWYAEAVHQKCSYKKLFWKYAANL